MVTVQHCSVDMYCIFCNDDLIEIIWFCVVVVYCFCGSCRLLTIYSWKIYLACLKQFIQINKYLGRLLFLNQGISYIVFVRVDIIVALGGSNVYKWTGDRRPAVGAVRIREAGTYNGNCSHSNQFI